MSTGLLSRSLILMTSFLRVCCLKDIDREKVLRGFCGSKTLGENKVTETTSVKKEVEKKALGLHVDDDIEVDTEG